MGSSWKRGSSHSKAVAGQERAGCLITLVQGCHVLGKMQDLMKQDFLGTTETRGTEASSAAQSIQETGPEGKEFFDVHCKERETATKSRESHTLPSCVWFAGTQEAKKRFRLRANLEERCQEATGRRQLIYQLLYFCSETECIMRTFSFSLLLFVCPFFKVTSSSLH